MSKSRNLLISGLAVILGLFLGMSYFNEHHANLENRKVTTEEVLAIARSTDLRCTDLYNDLVHAQTTYFLILEDEPHRIESYPIYSMQNMRPSFDEMDASITSFEKTANRHKDNLGLKPADYRFEHDFEIINSSIDFGERLETMLSRVEKYRTKLRIFIEVLNKTQ